MAVINILIPSLSKKKFYGGILAIFKYADGLCQLGHEVNVIPIASSHYPQWHKPSFKIILLKQPVHPYSFFSALAKKNWRTARKSISGIMSRLAAFSTYSYQRAGELELIRDRLPAADITISTAYETALPNYLYGKGRRFYFVQHFEPLFAAERENECLAYVDAMVSYRFPEISIIANSSWLAAKIEDLTGREIPVCWNAIDHQTFHPPLERPNHQNKIVVLSYGGRKAEWKGIHDAAEAIRIARATIPQIEWRVFGESLLPPQNCIAPYTPLGYITGETLRNAYVEADIMLCTSWYESFPLYPLEAMACGTAVISTPFGIEDYLTHMHNGYLVPPQKAEDISAALILLCRNTELRHQLSSQAQLDAKKFTWERSVQRLANLLGLANNEYSAGKVTQNREGFTR